MGTLTTNYSFNLPTVGGDSNTWGGASGLNANWSSIDALLGGDTPVVGIDIDSGTLDGVTIGGNSAGLGTFTTATGNLIKVGTTGVTGGGAAAQLGNSVDRFYIAPTDGAGAYDFTVEFGYDQPNARWYFEDDVLVGSTMFFDKTNERIGIGELTPDDEIHITTASPAIKLEDSTDSSYMTFGYDAAAATIAVDPTAAAASSKLSITVDGAETVVVDPSGLRVVVGGIREKVGTMPSGTTPEINADNGGVQTWTLTGDSTPTEALNDGDYVELHIDDGAAYTVDWTTSGAVDEWIGGSAPTLDLTSTTIVSLQKVGTTVIGQARGAAS